MDHMDKTAMLDERLQEEGLTTLSDLSDLHAALTAQVAACDITAGQPDCRDDQSVVPLWLPEALTEMITRLGYTITESEGATLIRTRWNMLTLGTIMVPVGGDVEIEPGLSVACRARLLCHELVHCLTGPPDNGHDGYEHISREIVAEGATHLVMAVLGAAASDASVWLLAQWSSADDGTGHGDAAVLEASRQVTVVAAGMMLLGLQGWQDQQASQVVASLEHGAS